MSHQGPYPPNFGRPSRHQIAHHHIGGMEPYHQGEFHSMNPIVPHNQMPQHHFDPRSHGHSHHNKSHHHGGHHGIGSNFLY